MKKNITLVNKNLIGTRGASIALKRKKRKRKEKLKFKRKEKRKIRNNINQTCVGSGDVVKMVVV